jgi:4-alpha-glucanotransferase
MTDEALRVLARDAGIETTWRDVHGETQTPTPDSLRGVLRAMGLDAATEARISESRRRLEGAAANATLVTATVGEPTIVPGGAARFRARAEDGTTFEGEARTLGPRTAALPPIDVPGYYRLILGHRDLTVAVAPRRCWGVTDATGGRPGWGLTVQLYAPRRAGDHGIGDFTGLRALIAAAAGHGADAMAVSPLHAQFSADPDRFSPYAPSSRVMLNVLHADAGALSGLAIETPPDQRAALARLEALDLVDWPAAARAKLATFRRLFDVFRTAAPGAGHEAFARFRREQGEALTRHATFEALHAVEYQRDPSRWSWRAWPSSLRHPDGPEVRAFAREHATDVTFHEFLQFLADRGLADTAATARDRGMAIGLITDLAIGADACGSQAWCHPGFLLDGLSIGAPPDLFSKSGQSWGVTTFSPNALAAHRFAPFIDVIRSALRHAGGLRMDHVMGLARLWLVPDGAAASEGAYVRYPLTDMLRLVALESWRHKAIVIGEDLGTLPDGFRPRLEAAGLAGMRVMWFERDGARWIHPRHWSRDAAAMTGTHDMPTVAGWWKGNDLAWRERLHQDPDPAAVAKARRERAGDRAALWAAFQEAGVADRAPPGEAGPLAAEASPPSCDDGAAVADAAAAYIGLAACDLALLPMEDALALEEQPNIPGTTTEHPNWRRRLPGAAGTMLDEPGVARRLAGLARRAAPK